MAETLKHCSLSVGWMWIVNCQQHFLNVNHYPLDMHYESKPFEFLSSSSNNNDDHKNSHDDNDHNNNIKKTK